VIYTHSAFYYGIEINTSNNEIAFSEGGPEIIATLTSARYTLTTFATEVARAMNEVGTLNYVVTVDRTARTYTISGDSNFSLLVSTGSSVSDAYPTIGFSGSDRTGDDSYLSNLSIGASYRPQFRLQNYVEFNDNQSQEETTLHKTASGKVELIKFRTDKIMECELMFITDVDQGLGAYITSNPTGVDDARAFLEYAIEKGPIEFIPDISSVATFTNCILESTSESSDGLGFRLKEEYAKGLPGYYTTGLLKFREVSL
jgi:hypothetical protein